MPFDQAPVGGAAASPAAATLLLQALQDGQGCNQGVNGKPSGAYLHWRHLLRVWVWGGDQPSTARPHLRAASVRCSHAQGKSV